MDHNQQEQIALHRWAVIAEAAGDKLTPGSAGRWSGRSPPGRTPHPDGSSRTLLAGHDRPVAAGLAQGRAGRRSSPRSGPIPGRCAPTRSCSPRPRRCGWSCPAARPRRSPRSCYHRHGVAVPERTVRGQLRRAGLHREALAAEPKAYGRYEAGAPNERWITDVLIGPWVPWPRRDGSVRARLFLIVDDHSRLLADGRFFARENARACQDLLRRAITRRGLPQVFYADNGAPFSNAWLARTCGVLGIRLVHSKPYSPEGRGKQERLNRYIREAFLAEATHQGIESLDALNDLFAAWAGQVANRRVHAETGQTPIEPVRGGRPAPPGRPALLREAFRWSVTRRVTRTATVPLEGNAYAVDPALVGPAGRAALRPRRPDPHRVFLDGKPAGAAVPFVTRRHVHRAVPAGRPPRAGPHRHRLPRPGRRCPRRGGRHRREDRLHPARQAPRQRTRPGAGAGGGTVSPAPWAAHFGLARTPFGKSIPARDLFARQAHAEAIARISFCVVESALGVVTGDVGAGKTVALRAAVAALDPTRHQVIYIANPAFGTRGLYVTIVRALGARPRYLKAELMAQAGDLLAAETAERHRRVVLICDFSDRPCPCP